MCIRDRSRIAKKVYLIHRRNSLRATKVYHEPLMAAPNVEFCWNSPVSALLHESRLTGLRLKDVNTSAERDLACDGVFISVGRAPATELFRSELALDKSGYIIADESTRTNLPGVCLLYTSPLPVSQLASSNRHTLEWGRDTDRSFPAPIPYDLLSSSRSVIFRRLMPSVDPLCSSAEVAGGSTPATPSAISVRLKPTMKRCV